MANYQRIMGLDVGSVTVGVAVSDLLGWTAQPIETIRINEDQGDFGFDRLSQLIKENGVKTVVIGLPKNMNNSIGPRAEASMAFGDRLLKVMPELEIVYQDERLSTSQAEKMLISGDVSRAKRKKVIDKVAAVIILQNYLDSQSI
ncbi:Holliday junction resolvase RuvX [Aerococcaceae bacterium DSM 111176]|nr:Holliday junction resolvase RuvX [Aerococcaceae bacterium DSM 111176]